MLKLELRQNFTVDPSVLTDVLEALEVTTGDKIVEVGPGKGVLTLKIIKEFIKLGETPSETIPSLLSYEVDEDLREDLEYLKRRNKGLFDYRIQNIIEANPKKGFNKCTGNIPYHISEPLFFKLIHWDFSRIVFITGIKFARKMTGEIPGKIGIMSKYLFESKITKEYDKNIFFPKSKVDSGLLVVEKKTVFNSDKEALLNQIFKNYDKKHQWLNKLLGYTQRQIGQIYHMDLELLEQDILNHKD